MDDAADTSRSRRRVPPWAWALLAAAVVGGVFFGYGQVELILDAVNLRYCG